MNAELILWMSVGFVVYAYIGYPLALAGLARFFGRPVRRAGILPRVSFIITARNEEARIEAKLANTLDLDYPRERLQIIVASDRSTDGTEAIVRSYANRGIRLVVAPERRGKEFAQKLAIDESEGEILVFSDVATRLAPECLKQMMKNFADPTVGCVSSVDRLIGPDGVVTAEGLYVRYEMRLRALESSLGTVIGLSGSLFAARREMCQPWFVDLPSDFTTLLNTLRRGLRGVSDPASVGYYPDLADPSREFNRKVRTVTRGIVSLGRNLELLNPLRYRLAAWQLFSHKVCRWLVPFAMVGALVTNMLLLSRSWAYLALGIAQLAIYSVAVVGFFDVRHLPSPMRALTYFVLTNVAILRAWSNALRGRQVVTWEPSKRADAVTR